MENEKRLNILLLADECPTSVLEIFKSVESTIINKDEEFSKEDIDYIVVKDHTTSFAALNDEYSIVDNNIRLVSLSGVKNYFDFVAANGCCIMDGALAESELFQDIYKRLITKDSSLHLEEAFPKALNNFKNVKISGHLGAGYYSDIVVSDACKGDYEAITIRSFIIHMISYFGFLKKGSILRFPVELEFGSNDDSYIVQMSAPVQNFVIEYIQESFAATGRVNPFKSLLNSALRQCDLMDIYYLKSSSKIVISGLWKKGRDHTNSFPSLVINQIERFETQRQDWKNVRVHPEMVLEKVEDQIVKRLERESLPAGLINLLSTSSDRFLKNPILLKRFVEFINATREVENDPIPEENLTVESITNYLKEYPNHAIVESLSDDDKEIILKTIWDPSVIDRINDGIKQVKEEVSNDNQETKDDLFDRIARSLDDMQHDEVNELIRGPLDQTVISGVTEDLSEETTMVKGSGAEGEETTMVKGSGPEGEETTMVKGSGPEGDENTLVKGSSPEEDKSKTKIEGTTHHITDEVWKIKSNDVKKDLKDAVMRIKSSGGSNDDLKVEMQKIIASHLGVKDVGSNNMAEGILDHAASSMASESFAEQISTVESSLDGELKEAEYLERIARQKKQIEKLTKMIGAIKVEHASTKKVAEVADRIVNSDMPEKDKLLEMTRQMKSSERDLHSRDLAIANLKKKLMLSESKVEQNSHVFEKRIEAFKKAEIKEDAHQVNQLQAHNDSLQSMVESTNKKLSRMSEEMENVRGKQAERNEFELKRLKESLSNALDKAQVLMREKVELGSRVNKAESDLKTQEHKMKEAARIADHSDERETVKLAQQEQALEKLRSDLADQIEKGRESKAQALESSRKLKAAEIQIEKLTKLHANKASKSSGDSGGEAKLTHRVKQLETLNERFEKSNKKALDDLNEKKKEVMKLKSENTAMNNELQGLRRKLGR